MKKILLVLPFFVLLLLTACQSTVQTSAGPTPLPDIPVETEEVGLGNIEELITYTGQVIPEDEISVLPTTSGKVDTVNYDIGARVSKGAVLFTMDKRTIEDNIRTLTAQLNTAQTAVKTATTAVENVTGGQWQSQMIAAQAAIDRAQLALDESKRSYETARTMFELDEISMEDLHKAETGVKNAQQAYDQAVATYEITSTRVASDNLETAQNALNQALAQVDTLQVQIQNAKGMLADTAVKAPISGIVSARNVQPGGVASMSAPAFTIVNIDTVEVVIKVTEYTINKLSAGQKVDLKIESAGKEPFPGTISLIPPAADQTKAFPVRIKISNPKHILKAGMFATAEFVINHKENVVIVPRSAIMTDEKGSFVFINKDNTAKKVMVEIGLDNGREIEIVSGLEEGTSLIVTGHTYLSEGRGVTPTLRRTEA